MTVSTEATRGPDQTSADARPAMAGWWGHPVAYVVTAVVLLVIFGGTFVVDPGRPAPADDPAYYSWRTELLIAEGPNALLDARGPREMYSSGYRVTTIILGAIFRGVAGVAPLTQTVWLMVGLRVLIPLLLAGFVARHRRDPLAFHVVALTSASLLLTPPLGGYLDNLVTLALLGAAAFLIGPSAKSWAARMAFGLLLFLSALTHPTTLVIFCGVLGAMAGVRLLLSRFDLRQTLREYAAPLATGAVTVLLGYAVWKLGVWGQPASLGDAALPPPAPASFFFKRLGGWVRAMRPLLNGPLFLLGMVSLVAVGRKWIQDDLARVAILWLLPLVGALGFLAGLAFPYYRFFNTTLAWVLLIAVGAWVATRFFIDLSHRPGASRAAGAAGLVAVGLIVLTNLTAGFKLIGWNDPEMAWMTPAEQRDLDAVRLALAEETRPVVFTVTTDATASERIWGAVKRAGNVARYGVPGDLLDSTYVCLGTIDSCGRGEALGDPGTFHNELSLATIDYMHQGLGAQTPLYVHVAEFNIEPPSTPSSNQVVLQVADGSASFASARGGSDRAPIPRPEIASSRFSWVWALLALFLLGIPGWFALRGVLPDAGLPQALGIVPVLSAALLVISGFVLVAFFRGPFTPALAWLSLLLATALGFGVGRIRPTGETT
ncbi:MAG TPA: hypothetical protein VHJ82_09875 [Actinomycetota bacterium]|nr:hypothetical protein [Actinomycetota bacterium]